ncbi:MAG: peroxiredoxin [Bacteroidota bacterium]
MSPMWGYLLAIVALGILGIIVEEKSGLLREGDVAPEFSARLTNGGIFRLQEMKGMKNVVLFFYPGDFTSGCTAQVCAFRDNFSSIAELDAFVVGVSKDSDDLHQKFIDEYQLPFSLIADTKGTLARSYGVLRLGGLIPIPKRVTYVVDNRGIVHAVIHHEVSMSQHVKDVIVALKEIEGR